MSNGGPLCTDSARLASPEEWLDMKLNLLRENEAEDLVERYDRLFGRGSPYWAVEQESGSGEGREGGGSKEEQQGPLGP